MNRRQFLKLMGITSLGSTLAGCQIFSDTPDYRVDIRDNRYLPAVLEIPRGTRVAWENKDRYVHTVTCDPAQVQNPANVLLPADAEAWHSGELYAGQFWIHTFDVPGTYVYFCRYHELNGMIGTITVQE